MSVTFIVLFVGVLTIVLSAWGFKAAIDWGYPIAVFTAILGLVLGVGVTVIGLLLMLGVVTV